MKKVILLLGISLIISMASCSEEETTMSNPNQSDTPSKSNEVFESEIEPIDGETYVITVEDEEFDLEMEPTVGNTCQVIDEDEKSATYGKPVVLKILCKRNTRYPEHGDHVGIGVDASGQKWYVTWDYSLQPNGEYTLKLTGHKLTADDRIPCY